MRATDFLALAARDPDAADRHIMRLLDHSLAASPTSPIHYASGNCGRLFFRMWDALPRGTRCWAFRECFGGRYEVWNWPHELPASVSAPTRNLAVAAALSEARDEEQADASD